MNKIVYMFVFALLTVSSYAQTNFKIKGSVDAYSEGTLIVKAVVDGKKIVFCEQPFKDGVFELSGLVKEPMFATISLKGFEGGFQFILEPNMEYKANLTTKSGVRYIESNGGLQSKWWQYYEAVNNYNTVKSNYDKQIDSARNEGMLRTASNITKKRDGELIGEREKVLAFLDANKDNIIYTHVESSKAIESGDIDVMKKTYNSFTELGKKTVPARSLMAEITKLSKIQVGQQAPDFTLNTPDGKAIKMSEVKAKIKIIDFWASWCGPCRKTNPQVLAMYNKFKSKGLEIIGVSLDENKDKWIDAIKKDGVNWIHVSSLKGWNCDVARQWAVTGVPTLFILDENNKIIATNLKGDDAHNFIEKILNK